MKSAYEAPVLIKYGRVEGLTASDIKCTPGDDGVYDLHRHDQQGGYTPPLHPGELTGTLQNPIWRDGCFPANQAP
jgi:hypothetical protein